jgi:hypothetical protein
MFPKNKQINNSINFNSLKLDELLSLPFDVNVVGFHSVQC